MTDSNTERDPDFENTKRRIAPAQRRLAETMRLRDRWWWWVAYGKPVCDTLDAYVTAAIPVTLEEERCGDFTCDVCVWRVGDPEMVQRTVMQRRALLREKLLKTHVAVIDGHTITVPSWDEEAVSYRRWLIDRGRKLCRVHPPAINGAGGSATCFKLCVALVQGLTIEPSIAIELVDGTYNPRCVDVAGRPSLWSWEELAHKIEDAETKSELRRGYLLDDNVRHDTGATGEDPKGSPGSAASGFRSSSTVVAIAPANFATVEIVGVHGLRTATVHRDVDSLQLRVLDGPYAGRVRRMQLDWPATKRSDRIWHYLARAIGLDEVRDPRRELLRRRIGVELHPDVRFGFKIGNIHPVDGTL